MVYCASGGQSRECGALGVPEGVIRVVGERTMVNDEDIAPARDEGCQRACLDPASTLALLPREQPRDPHYGGSVGDGG